MFYRKSDQCTVVQAQLPPLHLPHHDASSGLRCRRTRSARINNLIRPYFIARIACVGSSVGSPCRLSRRLFQSSSPDSLIPSASRKSERHKTLAIGETQDFLTT